MAEPLPLRPPQRPADPKPPKHLSAKMKRFWRDVVRDFELTPAGLELLRRAAEAWDTGELARKELATHGKVTVLDRFGQEKEHPAAKTARDQAMLFSRLLRELQLEPPGPDSRPPRMY